MSLPHWYASELSSISIAVDKDFRRYSKIIMSEDIPFPKPETPKPTKTLCASFYAFWKNLCGFQSTEPESSSDRIFSPRNTKENLHKKSKVSSPSDTEDEFLHKHNGYHSGLITRAYLPMRLTLMVLGRWPFRLILKSVDPDNRSTKLLNRLRVQNYDPRLRSPAWIYFGLTSLLIFFVMIQSTRGFFDFFLDWAVLPDTDWAKNQKKTFRNNLVMFLLVQGCLLHSTLSSFSLFLMRKKVARALNFFNVAAEELNIGSISKHRRFLIIANLTFVLFFVLIYFAYSWWNIRFVRDGATLFGTLTILPLLNEDQLGGNGIDERKLRLFGICLIIYCIYASRAFLFIFCFKCRLLRTLFSVWNARLVKFLKRPEGTVEDESGEKLECFLLLRDMTILLKMVKQTDEIFAVILQSYYAIQLPNMCFELYMLSKSGSKEFATSGDNTTLDVVSALMTLVQNVYFFFTVSLDGAFVGEEAALGLEFLRRHPVTPQASVYRKYLAYNLSVMYNQRIVLTGGKYFTIDRPFIITVLGSVLTYFIIILQVQPFQNDGAKAEPK